MYDKIRSEYLRKKIKGLKWNQKNGDYIDDLLHIEQFVLGNSFGWMTGYLILSLKEKHPKEYAAIYKELNLKGYAREKRNELRERKKESEWENMQKLEAKKKEEREKKLWKAAGGKL